MKKARLSPSPHLAWLGYWQHVSDESPLVIHRRHVAHYLAYIGAGRITTRWVTRSVERKCHSAEGTVRFYPADQERHTLIGQANPVNDFYILVIPTTEEEGILTSEGMTPHAPLRHLHVPDDVELKRCMMRLASRRSLEGNAIGHEDEAARRLILRLVELSGGGTPEWHADGSVFDRRTLDDLVNYIDAHLKIAPSLSDISMLVGLSPSHFAKKFRHSIGLSVHRFINRRRIRASLELLKDQGLPLAHVAFELGFSSQSHFTRLFSDLTGMTPAKYRRQFRKTVG